jgi:flagellar hook-basal body complex protein FliE
MGIEMAGQIKADLAALTNEAQRLAIAPSVESAPQSGQADFSFAETMKNAVRNVDAEDQAAAAKMADVETGKSDDLVGAMLASQQASLSFSMLMQVRNKVMGAVDELMKLPV